MNPVPDGFLNVATVMSHKLTKSYILENKMSILRCHHITFQYLSFHQILKKRINYYNFSFFFRSIRSPKYFVLIRDKLSRNWPR